MNYQILKRNKYFEVLGGLNSENRSDNKVGMVIDIDLTEMERIRSEVQRQEGIKPTYTAFLVKAIAGTLTEHKHVNKIPLELPFLRRLVQLLTIDISVAVEKDMPGAEQAVYVATIRKADQKSLLEITSELKFFTISSEQSDARWKLMKTLVEKIPFVWLSKLIIQMPRYWPALWLKHRGGAAMISSPSKYGVDLMMATWPWPVGFSFGLAKDRVVAINGKPEVRKTMAVTLSFDRRIMGGAPAARFFRGVCDKLEKPNFAVSTALDLRSKAEPELTPPLS